MPGVGANQFDLGHAAPGTVFFLMGMGIFAQVLLQAALPNSKFSLKHRVFDYIYDGTAVFTNPFRCSFLTIICFAAALALSVLQQTQGAQGHKNTQHFYMYTGLMILCGTELLERRKLIPRGGTVYAWMLACANTGILFSGHTPHFKTEDVLHTYIVKLYTVMTLTLIAYTFKPKLVLKAVFGYLLMLLGSMFLYTAAIKNHMREIEAEAHGGSPEKAMAAVMEIHMVFSRNFQLLFAICGLLFVVAHKVKRQYYPESVDDQTKFSVLTQPDSPEDLEAN